MQTRRLQTYPQSISTKVPLGTKGTIPRFLSHHTSSAASDTDYSMVFIGWWAGHGLCHFKLNTILFSAEIQPIMLFQIILTLPTNKYGDGHLHIASTSRVHAMFSTTSAHNTPMPCGDYGLM